MKWLKRNTVELVLGISGTVFLTNYFTYEDYDMYMLSIPFVVLGLVLLYKRHCRSHVFETSIFSYGDDEEDDLYEDAKEAVIEAGKASTSFLQQSYVLVMGELHD